MAGIVTTPIASVQLYSLRDQLAEDLEGSLDRLVQIGLTHVEAFGFVDRAPALRAALDARGLVAPTGHAPLLSDELWTPYGTVPAPAPELVFEAAAVLGVSTVFEPFVDPARWLTREGVDDIADRLNAAAETAAGFGLTVGYHNHAQEFVASFDGVSAYEYVIGRLDDRVAIELDLFWAETGGQDVPALTERLGSRLTAVHVKDGAIPQNPWAPGSDLDPADVHQTRPGEGAVQLVESLRSNDSVRYAVIEYDRAPGDVFDDVAASLAFLRSQGLAQ